MFLVELIAISFLDLISQQARRDTAVSAFLLFLLYFNDLYNSSDKLRFYLIADNIYLLYAD